GADETTAPPAPIEENSALLIPWTKPPAKRFKEILLPASTARSRARPMKAERRTALIKSIARGRATRDRHSRRPRVSKHPLTGRNRQRDQGALRRTQRRQPVHAQDAPRAARRLRGSRFVPKADKQSDIALCLLH